MKKYLIILLIIPELLTSSDKSDNLRKRIPIQSEEQVNIKLDFGAGNLYLSPSKTNLLFDGEFIYSDFEPIIKYSTHGNEGDLIINMSDDVDKDEDDNKISISSINDIKKNEWDLKFTNRIPLTFDIDIGAASANLDLGGMMIVDFKMSTGASETFIDFSEPNPITMNELFLDTGVSEFEVINLLNSNFDKMTFDGGIGDYKLQFGGELEKTVSVNIDVAFGSLIIYIPEDVAFRIDSDNSIFNSLDVENAREKDDDIWYSLNFQRDKPFIDMRLDAGVGSVSVRTIR